MLHWELPEEGSLKIPALLSGDGDFCNAIVWELSNGLPSSDAYVPYLVSSLSLRLTLSETQFTGASSPATRPRFSHRKLHDGEYRIFLGKTSPPDPFVIVLSLAATQQADPMLAHIQHKNNYLQRHYTNNPSFIALR